MTMERNLVPIGCVQSRDLHTLAKAMDKLSVWHRKHGGKKEDTPCLRLIQGARNGKITALVQSGSMMLKMALKDGEWVALGDALTTTTKDD